jgi:hypothetical protein
MAVYEGRLRGRTIECLSLMVDLYHLGIVKINLQVKNAWVYLNISEQ